MKYENVREDEGSKLLTCSCRCVLPREAASLSNFSIFPLAELNCITQVSHRAAAAASHTSVLVTNLAPILPAQSKIDA
uniref:Uncharacterized protein n=1 Tax=Setaria italica TaxID=4555 RepID=K3YNP4_SETIT